MRVRSIVPMFVGVLLSLVLGACAGGDPNGTIQAVAVIDNGFSPATLTIAPGTTVSWSWAGFNPHDVRFTPASGIPNSDVQTVGSFQALFTTPGTYPYNCSLHISMTGTIIVR